MNCRCAVSVLAAWLAVCAVAAAFDTVKTTTSSITCKVTKTSPLVVSIERNNVPQEVPVNQITSILFDGEPKWLNIARLAAASGRYEDAGKALAKVKLDDVRRREIREDFEYYQAFCAAQLALGGSGKIVDAGSQMVRFVNTHKTNYHWLAANEVVGNLLVASGKYSEARKYYAEVEGAPWPDYKIRAQVALGRALLAEKKPAEALKAFDSALSIEAEGAMAEVQRMTASLGKARCQAETGQHDEAVKLVQGIILKADPEQVELHARAYNTLGTALRKAKRPKEALLAFLHVDRLYFTIPDAHAEALANLVDLWRELHMSQRAMKARQTLQTSYKDSPWAKQQGG